MKKKILVIEDDYILQDAIKNALELDGFEIIQSFDGEKGLELMEEVRPDLILLDLMLPKKDGYHVLKDINENKDTRNIPVIVLTVVDSKTSQIECKMFGNVDYLVKSENTIQQVVDIINNKLNKQQNLKV